MPLANNIEIKYIHSYSTIDMKRLNNILDTIKFMEDVTNDLTTPRLNVQSICTCI